MTFEPKVDTTFTHALANVYANFGYSAFFELGTRIHDREQTDGRTDGRTRRVMWPTGRPHNKTSIFVVEFARRDL